MQAENRCEARVLAGGGDAGAMQCDARRLGTYARSDWRRAGVSGCSASGGVVVIAQSGGGSVCMCTLGSESLGAGGWRGESVSFCL